MILVQSVVAMKEVDSSIASEYRQRLERIRSQYPLQPPVDRALMGMTASLTSD